MPHSNASEHINRLLEALSPEQGKNPSLNKDDMCSLTIDERLECNMEIDGDDLIVFSPLLRLPTSEVKELLSNALRANLFGLDTEGGHLGLCEQSGFIVYSKTMRINGLSEATFLETFEDFVRVAFELETEFSRPPSAPAEVNSHIHHSAGLRV